MIRPQPFTMEYFAIINGISSNTSANKASYNYYYGDTIVVIASPSIVINSTYYIVTNTESSIVSVTSNKASSAGIDSTTSVMMTTQLYSSPSSLPFELLNNYMKLSAISIPTEPLMNTLEPYYTCCWFIFSGVEFSVF